ncbi:putative RING-type domain-containing protein [Seiridium unicorne]|uniref:RING-type domain-containing protein n=1 Tax=Seiridium unicorne TaxID=138068 RepID=A0ABR2V9B3_9PEZI
MSGSPSPVALPAIKAALCDLLVGNVEYPCGHEFNTLLDYSLARMGERSVENHQCPLCAEEGKCLVCLHPWDPAQSDSCPTCDTFFVRDLLYDRAVQLHQIGITPKDDKPALFRMRRNEELRLKAVRLQRLQARKLSDSSKRENEGV